MTTITFPRVKKYLETLSQDEIEQEIKTLFDSFPQVKEYYQVKLADGGQEAMINKYRNVIDKEFYAPSNQVHPGPGRVSVARKAVLTFQKLSNNKLDTLDIMLHYVKQGVTFAQTYGYDSENFDTSMATMFESAVTYAEQQGLKETTKTRFKEVVDSSSRIEYGLHELLADLFETHFPKAKTVIDGEVIK